MRILRISLNDEKAKTLYAFDDETVDMISRFNTYLSPQEVRASLVKGETIHSTFAKWRRED